MSDADQNPPVVIRQYGSPAVWWVIALSQAIIAVCLLARTDFGGAAPAYAQPVSAAGARGVFAFTGQLTKNSYGVFMVDVDAYTLWCYEYSTSKNMLRLVAGRDWRYDRYLRKFSTEPMPDVIQQMVEDERAAAIQAANP